MFGQCGLFLVLTGLAVTLLLGSISVVPEFLPPEMIGTGKRGGPYTLHPGAVPDVARRMAVRSPRRGVAGWLLDRTARAAVSIALTAMLDDRVIRHGDVESLADQTSDQAGKATSSRVLIRFRTSPSRAATGAAFFLA